MTRYFYYIINIFVVTLLKSQSPEDLLINQITLTKLEHGSLLVLLESKENTIQFLQNQQSLKNCDEKCRSDIQKQIDEITNERDEFNKAFIQSFKLYFKFCPVDFIYDKDLETLRKQNYNSSLYIDENLLAVNSNHIHKDSLVILKKDFTPHSDKSGWLFQTIDGYVLKNGFPYVIENSFRTLMTRFAHSHPENAVSKYYVQKLDYLLYKKQMNKEHDLIWILNNKQ
jgi:hypothetical protein